MTIRQSLKAGLNAARRFFNKLSPSSRRWIYENLLLRDTFSLRELLYDKNGCLNRIRGDALPADKERLQKRLHWSVGRHPTDFYSPYYEALEKKRTPFHEWFITTHPETKEHFIGELIGKPTKDGGFIIRQNVFEPSGVNKKILENYEKGLYEIKWKAAQVMLSFLHRQHPESALHSEGVSAFTVALCTLLNEKGRHLLVDAGTGRPVQLSPPVLREMRIAGLIHDWGKADPRVLPLIASTKRFDPESKEGREARKKIGQHRTYSFADTHGLFHETFPVQALEQHHPDEIIDFDKWALAGRIMAVADVFEARTSSKRGYKKSETTEQVFKGMREEAAKRRLDGKLVEFFVENFAAIHKIAMRELREEAAKHRDYLKSNRGYLKKLLTEASAAQKEGRAYDPMRVVNQGEVVRSRTLAYMNIRNEIAEREKVVLASHA